MTSIDCCARDSNNDQKYIVTERNQLFRRGDKDDSAEILKRG